MPIEHLEELAFYATDVLVSEETRRGRPVSVVEGEIVRVFGSEDEGSEEDTVESPFFGLDPEVSFGSMDVDEGYQDGGHLHVCGAEDVCDEVREIGAFLGVQLVGPAAGGGGLVECVVDRFRGLLGQVVFS